jgi:hypothetical protein
VTKNVFSLSFAKAMDSGEIKHLSPHSAIMTTTQDFSAGVILALGAEIWTTVLEKESTRAGHANAHEAAFIAQTLPKTLDEVEIQDTSRTVSTLLLEERRLLYHLPCGLLNA